MTDQHLILASQSPFRRELLASAGISVTCIGSEVDEEPIVGANVEETAALRADAKAVEVSLRHPEAIVIGADQALAIGASRMDKVKTADEAADRLELLQGKTHILYSAYSIARAGKVILRKMVPVTMKMRSLSPEEICAYVATGEWQGSVGCYKIEAKGVRLFESIGGDHSSIVGLPVWALARDLVAAGYPLEF